MSKVSITGNASGSGTFTIAAPNSNSDRTLNLPDSAGTLLHDASSLAAANLTGDVAAARITGALNATGSAPIYACRAWVQFNGSGTVTINGSGNVSSIGDVNVGWYTVNFSIAMPDQNYSVVMSAIDTNYGTNCATSGLVTTSNFSFYIHKNEDGSTTRPDPIQVYCAVFR